MTLRDQIAQIAKENVDGYDTADQIMDLYRKVMSVIDHNGPVHSAMSHWTVREFLYREKEEGEPTHEAAMTFAEGALQAALDAAEDGVGG